MTIVTVADDDDGRSGDGGDDGRCIQQSTNSSRMADGDR